MRLGKWMWYIQLRKYCIVIQNDDVAIDTERLSWCIVKWNKVIKQHTKEESIFIAY